MERITDDTSLLQDGPYQPGSKIIMYHWVRQAPSNMLWQIQYLS